VVSIVQSFIRLKLEVIADLGGLISKYSHRDFQTSHKDDDAKLRYHSVFVLEENLIYLNISWGYKLGKFMEETLMTGSFSIDLKFIRSHLVRNIVVR